MKREVDPSFSAAERLWRRIEVGHVRKDDPKLCKPSAFRLQVSISRERHGDQAKVCSGKFNGIAEATAETVCAITLGDSYVVCVDEPMPDDPGHALVALVLDPDARVPQDVVAAVRESFAKAFRVVVAPKAA